ncbi:MAG TPA: VanW family protein [Candidatus Omnitrophota bacterium]|nr:VanW family protein [Candidatus Omnitrophota bacterium]
MLVAAIFLFADYFRIKNSFPNGTFIGAVDVSQLSRDEAVEKISNAPISAFIRDVTFRNPANSAESFSYLPQELGIHVLPAETVDNAFDLTHKENYIRDLNKRLSRETIILPASFAPDDDFTRQALADLSQKIDTPAMDSAIILNEETGGYHITPDRPARKLLSDESLANAKKRLLKGETVIPLAIDYYGKPKVAEAILRAAPPVYRLSAFTTYYGAHDSPNRIHNIKLIASWINNTLLLSNEVFSLLDIIGDFSEERGFKEAYVITGGELVPELGGGTCQIGTTLYNTVALADLDVLSRRNHSFYFNIYPLGRDATVYPGQVDFKFKNNTGHPILLKALATNRKLSFRIYGTPTGKTVEFSNPSIYLLDENGSYRPASLKEVLDSDRPFRTTLVRTVKDAKGNVLKEETIRSFYKLYGDKTNVPIKRPEPR